jgi:hypothetical protein
MRQTIVVSCATAIFLLCFATVYLSFHAASPPMRALAGGGLFFMLALLLLWKDGVRLETKRRLADKHDPATGVATKFGAAQSA